MVTPEKGILMAVLFVTLASNAGRVTSSLHASHPKHISHTTQSERLSQFLVKARGSLIQLILYQ